MKRADRAVKAASYVWGIFVIAAAMLLAVFLFMSAIGLIHPRKVRITLYTESISMAYDGSSLQGSMPVISQGSLHAGHKLEVRNIPQYSEVGTYVNAPEFLVLDGTGADVTGQYDIICDFGNLTVQARKITLFSEDKSKQYDGETLESDAVQLVGGTLVAGHKLVMEEGAVLRLPGTKVNGSDYRIVSENGTDVTDQYAVTEKLGKLEILPVPITVSTKSAKKIYDGKSLSAREWEHIGGRLLPGHTIDMTVTASLTDVGNMPNEGTARILDQNGNDVSAIYSIGYSFGTLEVKGIPLYISTKSAQKTYDGKPLSCEEWELTKGKPEEGAVIEAWGYSVHQGIGSIDNRINFRVIDKNGMDITYRYSVVCDYGTLNIQPRAITIRTGSDSKVYDGLPLTCNTFEIISGSLCEGEQISITCTSVVEVGYSENIVLLCVIYRKGTDGSVQDVSSCYRVTFDYGVLKVTAG